MDRPTPASSPEHPKPQRRSPKWRLGVFVITFISRMPWCIGFLFGVVVGCIGLGAIVLTRFGTQAAIGRPPAGSDPSGDVTESPLLTPSNLGTASTEPSAAIVAVAADQLGVISEESTSTAPTEDSPETT